MRKKKICIFTLEIGMSDSSVNEISTGIIPFGDSKIDWDEDEEKSCQKRFGVEDKILWSAPR
jgi:hypothetical protein